MKRTIRKKIILLFFSLLMISLFQGISSAEWITKKSDISNKLLKVDDMYAKGYLSKSECVKAKAKLLKISDATGMCDNVYVQNDSSNNDNKTYNWFAEAGHPKTNRIFTADRVSSKDNAIKIAIKKCYEYVTANLNKRGYNDCFIKKAYDSTKKTEVATNKKNLKETDMVVDWITVKDTIKNKKKSEELVKKLKNLPSSEFYVYAFKEKEIFLVGYANQDKLSKLIKVKNRKFRKGNTGIAYKNTGVKCFVYSEVDENSLGNRSYTGDVKVYCDDKTNYIGNWVQYEEKGSGTAIDSSTGEQIDFSFAMSKNIALADLNKSINNIEIAEKETVTGTQEKNKQKEFEPENFEEDSNPPVIRIAKTITVQDSNYKIFGEVEDRSDKIFIEVDGNTILAKDGKFEISRFSPINEKLEITAIDKWGNVSEPVLVEVVIDNKKKMIAEKIEPLNPSKIRSNKNKNRVALIIGIENYDKTPAATFANLDAKYFYEYAQKSFGISTNNIEILVNEDANLIDTLGKLNKWLPGKIRPNKTELVIFFAGHGLASTDGEKLFLLPQDGDPDLLERSALSRKELFETILKTKPKTVTMFFDTCFSGISRDEKTLLASARPVRIVPDEENNIPKNFTIFSASQLDQISSGLSEAKNGIFSYYLMKGLEGKADSNKDRKITNGELLAYMIENVSQKAAELGREQIPSLVGDRDQILTRY